HQLGGRVVRGNDLVPQSVAAGVGPGPRLPAAATRWPAPHLLMSHPTMKGGFFSIDSLRGVLVLVVDDDPRGRRTLAEILTYCGALVTPSASVEDAFRVMRRIKPDLLVVALTDDESL